MEILITENQLKKIVENEEKDNLFYSTEYNPETKKLRSYYYLYGEKPDSYQILNIKEIHGNGVWANGKASYTLLFDKIFVPKKFVNKLDEHPTKKGYFEFELPYWLYKNEKALNLKRIPTDFKKFSNYNLDPSYMKNYTDPKVVEALIGLDTDEDLIRIAQINYDRIVNPQTPKQIETSDNNPPTMWNFSKKSGPEHLSNQ
jgi:hypothetical protein